MPELVLASGSPRRAALLHQLGLAFTVLKPDIDETPLPGEPAPDYVRRMSVEKSLRASEMLDQDRRGHVIVLCADTDVVLDDKILGKPASREECIGMLMSLSAREHRVMTGVTVSGPAGSETRVVETIVTFRQLSRAECGQYWATGEPADKAGGYGIQGIGAIFVATISGSYSNVVGLPLPETAQMLVAEGVDCIAQAASRYEKERDNA